MGGWRPAYVSRDAMLLQGSAAEAYRSFLLHRVDKRHVANVAKAVGELNIGDAVSAAVDIPYSRRSAAVILMCRHAIIA